MKFKTILKEMANTPTVISLAPDYQEKIDALTDAADKKLMSGNKIVKLIAYLKDNPEATQPQIVKDLFGKEGPDTQAHINPQVRALLNYGIITKGKRTEYTGQAEKRAEMEKRKSEKPESDIDVDLDASSEEPESTEPETTGDDFLDKIPSWQRSRTYFPKTQPKEEPEELPGKDEYMEKVAAVEEEISQITSQMAAKAKEFKTVKGTPQEKSITDELKQLTAKKKELQAKLDGLTETKYYENVSLIEGYERLQKIAGIVIR